MYQLAHLAGQGKHKASIHRRLADLKCQARDFFKHLSVFSILSISLDVYHFRHIQYSVRQATQKPMRLLWVCHGAHFVSRSAEIVVESLKSVSDKGQTHLQ
jgi:hypothetical protein